MYIVVLRSQIEESPWRVQNASSSLNRIRSSCIGPVRLLARRRFRIIENIELRSCRTGRLYDCTIIEVPNFIQRNLVKLTELQLKENSQEI